MFESHTRLSTSFDKNNNNYDCLVYKLFVHRKENKVVQRVTIVLSDIIILTDKDIIQSPLPGTHKQAAVFY